MRLATVAVEGARAPKMVAALTVDGAEWLVDLTQAYAAYLFVVEGEQYADDLARARLQSDMLRLLQGGERSMLAARRAVDYARDQLASASVRSAWRTAAMLWPLDSVRFLPPILRPGKLITTGSMFKGHSTEVEHVLENIRKPSAPEANVGLEKEPFDLLRGSQKITSAQVGHGQPIVRDSRHTSKLDYEAELAVVIGKRCKDIRPEAAFDVVAGFTCMNDTTMRDVHSGDKGERQLGSLFFCKSFDTGAPVGPYLVTTDEVPDPQNLQIQLRVNGIVHQSDNTGNMGRPIAEIIAYWSRMTLEPGDLISTGTPAGVGFAQNPPFFLQPGDEVEIEITHVGVLRNRVVTEADVPTGPLSAGVFAERR